MAGRSSSARLGSGLVWEVARARNRRRGKAAADSSVRDWVTVATTWTCGACDMARSAKSKARGEAWSPARRARRLKVHDEDGVVPPLLENDPSVQTKSTSYDCSRY